MAFLGKVISKALNVQSFNHFKNYLGEGCMKCQNILGAVPECYTQSQQTRNRYVNWRMWRDVKRRRMVKEYAPERLRVNALRKSNILPEEIKAHATREIRKFPRDSNRTRIVNRCIVTSRASGVKARWHTHRVVLRSLMDYNIMSGMIRARWLHT